MKNDTMFILKSETNKNVRRSMNQFLNHRLYTPAFRALMFKMLIVSFFKYKQNDREVVTA
jgi:hypothetical protein